jgi:ABC-2 type transport system ATP-binding protein
LQQEIESGRVSRQAVTVDVEYLSREFDSRKNRVVALDGVSLQVREGEIFGLLGPNGAGKTTMIRILSTLLLPTGGSAHVMGHDVASEAEKVRSVINMASGAERAGYDFISARGNLWFFSQLYGIPTPVANKRIAELSQRLGLEKYLERKFYTLSTGYKQRLTIARAFINDPKVVFLDEPTIGLDVMTALSIRDFLKFEAREHGRTIILATHNMAEVDAICDRVAIIDRGKILASDSPHGLKKLFGSPALVMEVQPSPDNLAMITAVKGVKGATYTVDEERGLASVKVVLENDDVAAAAQEMMKSAGFKLLSSWRQETTLEEVFISLVGRGFREREEESAD